MYSHEMKPGLGATNNSIVAQMQRAAAKQQKLNLCPCGCADKDLNEHGYCKHLIGWTNDFDHETGAPKVGGVIELRELEGISGPFGSVILERTGVKKDELLATDILVPITTTARVYRGVRVIKATPQSDMAVMQQQLEAMKKELEEVRKGQGVAAKPKKTKVKRKEPELQPA